MPVWQDVLIAAGRQINTKMVERSIKSGLFSIICKYVYLFLAVFVEALWDVQQGKRKDAMRRWERWISKLWKKQAGSDLDLWAGKVNPSMHRLLQSWTDEPSDERSCFGLWVTSEHFPGLRAKLYMEIFCKCLNVMRSSLNPTEHYFCDVWSVKKMWMQLFQPQSPHNIINSNIIWQRFAATLDIWYLWRLADFPPGFANCGHRWLIAQQLSINNQTWTKSSALQGARPCVWLPCISGTLESPELCRLLILITVV